MPEVGGKEREHSFDIESGLVPVDEGSDSEGMTKLVDPWPVRNTLCEADAIDEALESLQEVLIEQSCVVQRDEKGDPRVAREPPPSLLGVYSERLDGTLVKRDLPGLSEFSRPDRQNVFLPVHVCPVQRDHLSNSRTCGCQKSDQGPAGECSKGIFQLQSSIHQLAYFLLGVKVGRQSTGMGKTKRRGNFRPRVEGEDIAGETANQVEPLIRRPWRFWLGRPV